MQRFMLDSMVLDELAASDAARECAIRRIERGELALLITHVQRDQFADAPAEKQALVATIPLEMVPTYGLVVGVSRIGMARIADRDDVEPFRTAGRGKMTDAPIGATARWEDAVLVTNDHGLEAKAIAAGVETWRPERLIEHMSKPNPLAVAARVVGSAKRPRSASERPDGKRE